MYPRTKQQTHDKGSMVQAQYCSEWTDLGYGMARFFRFLCSEMIDEGLLRLDFSSQYRDIAQAHLRNANCALKLQ